MNMNTPPFLVSMVLLLAMALTAGCDSKQDPKVATQVAARVNADEITVHQINNILNRSQSIAPEVAAQTKRDVLDRLVDQQLARQKAIENELDRSPSVVQTIEAAKTEILARAYLERLTAAIPGTAAWEVEKYYKEHPELFAQRRLFNLEEIAFAAKSDVASGLREHLPRARSMQEIADWLQSREIKFAVNRGVRAAEQISLEILPKVHGMKEGQNQLFEVGSERYLVIRVIGYKVEPVDAATAAPRIQQFLFNQRSRETIAREMKTLRERAKIEYVGEFAAGAAAADTKAQKKTETNTRSEEPKEQPRK
jgi:EpsD family peptidyl-prolyl cis-trans isomerase